VNKDQFAVTLTADLPALWTWLELDGIDARFSDNYVHLYPTRAQQIICTPGASLTLQQFRKALRINSLADTY
jgi:beta-mannosidase